MKRILFIGIFFCLFSACSKNTIDDSRNTSEQSQSNLENPSQNAKENKLSLEEFPFEKVDLSIPKNLYKIKDLKDSLRIKEGFISLGVYQVKVTSLKTDKEQAYNESLEVAKRKAHKMLLSEAIPYLSPESKVEIKIIVEEFGKMIAESDLIEDKFHFVFQISKPALKILIKEKLK